MGADGLAGAEVTANIHPAVLRRAAAARYMGSDPGWLDDAPIPRVDLRLPGARRPAWGWRVEDMDRYLAARVVEPGQRSHIE
jgi:hypothetical protein